MRDFDLIEFIAGGRLGYIRVGSTRHDVNRAFGKPRLTHAWMGGNAIDPIAWNFDDLYVGFDNTTELVSCIKIRPKNFKKKQVKIGLPLLLSHGINFGIEIEQFEALVEPFGLFYSQRMRWDCHGWVLEYPSGVEVLFQGQTDKTAPLFEICI